MLQLLLNKICEDSQLPSSLIVETGRVVTPMVGNEEEVNEVGVCKPTPVAAVAKSSVGVFNLFFKFGVGLRK